MRIESSARARSGVFWPEDIVIRLLDELGFDGVDAGGAEGAGGGEAGAQPGVPDRVSKSRSYAVEEFGHGTARPRGRSSYCSMELRSGREGTSSKDCVLLSGDEDPPAAAGTEARAGHDWVVCASPVVPLGTKERSASAEPPGLASKVSHCSSMELGSGREGTTSKDCVLLFGDEDPPAAAGTEARAGHDWVVCASPVVPLGTKERSASAELPGLASELRTALASSLVAAERGPRRRTAFFCPETRTLRPR